jgi:Zn-dependent peptidase ImmA (M78 family)
LRAEWDLGIDPIPNMTELLEDQGIKVLILPLPEKVSGLTCLVSRPEKNAQVPVIVVNDSHNLERRRHTLAHELAHRLIRSDSPVDHEKASAIFAGAFLVTRKHLIREIGNDRKALSFQELIHLKRMYRVSAASLLMRLKQVGIVDQSIVTYAFQTFARTWRRDEPSPLESRDTGQKYECPRRFERLCYRALAEKLISPARAGELLQRSLDQIEQGMRGPAEADADHHQ